MNILLVADTCEDRWMIGECNRLSPEAPVPIFTCLSSGSNAGMGGNVLANLRSLAPHATVSAVFPEALTVKMRYVDRKSNHHLLRIDEDAKVAPLRPDQFTDVLDTQKWDACVISDYGKGFLTPGNMEAMLSLCQEREIPTFVDTKAILGGWSENATFVKINGVEAASHDRANVVPWAWCENLIVTQGGDGMVLYAGPDSEVQYRSHGVEAEVADQAGAGDSVLAALVVKYLENGGNIRTAMDWANRVGAIAVSRRGVVAVQRSDVDD